MSKIAHCHSAKLDISTTRPTSSRQHASQEARTGGQIYGQHVCILFETSLYNALSLATLWHVSCSGVAGSEAPGCILSAPAWLSRETLYNGTANSIAFCCGEDGVLRLKTMVFSSKNIAAFHLRLTLGLHLLLLHDGPKKCVYPLELCSGSCRLRLRLAKDLVPLGIWFSNVPQSHWSKLYRRVHALVPECRALAAILHSAYTLTLLSGQTILTLHFFGGLQYRTNPRPDTYSRDFVEEAQEPREGAWRTLSRTFEEEEGTAPSSSGLIHTNP